MCKKEGCTSSGGILKALTVIVGYIRQENLTYLWSWTPGRVTRSAQTMQQYVTLYRLILYLKTVKGLKKQINIIIIFSSSLQITIYIIKYQFAR